MNPSTGVSITTSLCRVKMNRALKRGGRDTLDVEAQTEGGCMALYDVWRVWLYGCMRCMRCIRCIA